MRFRSIKTQLIASVLVVELVSAVLGTSLVVLNERHARFHAFDIMLRGRADSLGAGSQILQPLAIAVIGGLLLSIFLSLIVTPVIYNFKQTIYGKV